MNNIEKIKFISRCFRIIFSVMIVITPLFFTAIWLCYNHLPSQITAGLFKNTAYLTGPLNLIQISGALIVSLIPASINIAGFYFLIKLFRLYETGQFFTLENVKLYQNLAWVYVFKAVGSIVHNSLLTLALTLTYPPGKRLLAIGLSSQDLANLLIGGIILVVSWVMVEAVKLQEENNFTV